MKSFNKFILSIFVLGLFLITPAFAFAQDNPEKVAPSAGLSKIIDFIEGFRRDIKDKLQAQKDIFDEKANIGEVSQSIDEDETTNYIIKGSSDKLIEPIFKVLSFIFSGLVLIFSNSMIFYLVLLFFIFIILRYFWRRAV